MELQPNPHASKISPGLFFTTLRFTSSDRGQGQRPGIAPRPRENKKKRKERAGCIGASVGRTEPPPIPLCFWDLMRRIRLSRDGVGVTSAARSAPAGRPGCRASPATGTSRLRPAGLGTDVAAVASGHAAAGTAPPTAGARTSVCVGGVERRPSQTPSPTVPGPVFDVLSASRSPAAAALWLSRTCPLDSWIHVACALLFVLCPAADHGHDLLNRCKQSASAMIKRPVVVLYFCSTTLLVLYDKVQDRM